MKKLNENLSEIFDVTPLEFPEEPTKTEVPVIIESDSNSDVESDFGYARQNIKELIRKSDDAIQGILKVADASEHPRAYEVAATLIKTVADLNKDLLDIQKKRKDLTGESTKQTNQTNIDKAVFVGSTAELIKMIKNKE